MMHIIIHEVNIMRKIFALVLAMLMVMSAAAMAEGALTVNNEVFNVIQTDYATYGYLFAKIENTGDAPITVGSGTMAIFDAAGSILETSDWVSCYPNNAVLQPGEYVYVDNTVYFDDGVTVDTVGEYQFVAKPYEYAGYEYVKIPCEAVLALGVDAYDSDYIDVTFTNTTDAILYDFDVLTAMYDANGALINVDYTWESSVGVHPGSTVTIKVYQDSTVMDYIEANGIVPTTVDAMVYYEIY
jgi:hypothetical protein